MREQKEGRVWQAVEWLVSAHRCHHPGSHQIVAQGWRARQERGYDAKVWVAIGDSGPVFGFPSLTTPTPQKMENDSFTAANSTKLCFV